MLRKINWFAVVGPMLITAMVLSACGGASTQPGDESPQSTSGASTGVTPAATDQSAVTPAATDQSGATPAATGSPSASSGGSGALAAPAVAAATTETPMATDQSMATPAATDQSMSTPSAMSTSSPSSSGALASPGATVQSATNATLGSILTDSQGMTLYVFKNDTPGVSNCTGNCTQNWIPLTVTAGQQPVAGTGITGQLGVIQRSDGTSQVTYNQMPLYRFSGDKAAGDTNGQGMAGLWSVVSLTATAPAAPSAATPAAPVAPAAPSAATPAAPAATPQATTSY